MATNSPFDGRQPLVSGALPTTADNLQNSARKWIVMVFMGVGDLENAADMSQSAADDLKELEDVKPHAGLNILAQKHDANGDVQRFHIGHGQHEVPPDDRDPRGGNALGRFLMWALATAGYERGDRTVLVLWGHAYQFTLGHAPSVDGVESLDFGELVHVLRSIQELARQQYGDAKIDLVGFDACDLSMIEVAAVLEPFAEYLVASEIGIPLPGWPYDRVFKRLNEVSRPGSAHPAMSPADLGAYIVRQFCGGYRDRRASLTLLDLGKAKDALAKTEALAGALAKVASRDLVERERLRALFMQSQTLPDRPFIDVADFCVDLSRHCRYEAVRNAAIELGDILIRPAANTTGEVIPDALRPFIVEHGRNGHETSKLQGVGLYAPHVAGPRYNWPVTKVMYDKFSPTQTLWNSVIHAFAS